MKEFFIDDILDCILNVTRSFEITSDKITNVVLNDKIDYKNYFTLFLRNEVEFSALTPDNGKH